MHIIILQSSCNQQKNETPLFRNTFLKARTELCNSAVMNLLYITASPIQITILAGDDWTVSITDRITPTNKLMVPNGLAREPVRMLA
jgi:hypothetical protein